VRRDSSHIAATTFNGTWPHAGPATHPPSTAAADPAHMPPHQTCGRTPHGQQQLRTAVLLEIYLIIPQFH
jgi:hypothetical protein